VKKKGEKGRGPPKYNDHKHRDRQSEGRPPPSHRELFPRLPRPLSSGSRPAEQETGQPSVHEPQRRSGGETRSIITPEESRSIIAPEESRSIIAPEESRSIITPEESRSIIITPEESRSIHPLYPPPQPPPAS